MQSRAYQPCCSRSFLEVMLEPFAWITCGSLSTGRFLGVVGEISGIFRVITASWAGSKGKQVDPPAAAGCSTKISFLHSSRLIWQWPFMQAGWGWEFRSLERNIRIWTTELWGSPPAWLYCPKYWQAFKSMRLACKTMLLKTEMSMVKDGVFFGLSKGSPIEPCEETPLSLFFYKYKKRKDYRTIDNVTLLIHHVGWIRIPSIQIWIHMNPFVTQESWHPALYSLLQLRIPTVITGYSLAEQIGGRGL